MCEYFLRDDYLLNGKTCSIINIKDPPLGF